MSTDDATILKNTEISVPRILLYCGSAPGQSGVGGIVLRDFCDALPTGTLRCFVVPPAASCGELKDCPEVIDFVVRRYDTAYRPVRGILGELIAVAARKVKRPRHLRTIVNRAVECGRSHRAELVWAVFHCPTVIQTAGLVASRLGVPLVVWVEDAPELQSHQLRHDRWFARSVMRDFHATIESSVRCAAIGETMKEAYDQAYRKDCIILRHGLKPSAVQIPQAGPSHDGKLVIGFAGSITAGDEFGQLLRALDDSAWRLDGRDVVLRLVGCRVLLDASAPQRIEYFGRQRTVSDTVKVLADCDILYLPQPFAEQLRPLAHLSFPAKLATYLASGRPVVLHAPEYGSLVPFFERYPFGTWCSSLEGDDILSAFRDLACNADRYRSAVQAGQAARGEELNCDTFVRRLRQLLVGDESSESEAQATPPSPYDHVAEAP